MGVSRAIRNVGALTYVSRSVERAATSMHKFFVRGFQDFDEMRLCPICQDGFELGRYGVLACRHIMHLDCRVLYEAYERGCQAPQRLPECSICNARFWGFVCIFV